MNNKIYVCIDLKSFFASVECRERNLDPLKTNLVVADPNRTQKTICLAVTPSLKQYGIPGRARLFEVIKKVKEINNIRSKKNNYRKFIKKSYDDDELKQNKNYELDYIIAPPQMKKYMKYSTDIYNIYLKYISPNDIYPYSIDEVFIDATAYLHNYNNNPENLICKMIQDVYNQTGITATAGIGTNMYLCKIAMDIVAKHTEPNSFGVRMSSLNEITYRKYLWTHTPITDFWRVGQGIAKRLEKIGIFTMGDIARLSINNEEKLYKEFGVNAELLIDHAWGYEPCTIKDAKSYKPNNTSISTGQVLHSPYDYEKTKLIVREMTDLLTLDLVDKKLVTNQIILTIGYDIDNLKIESINKYYKGEITIDHYGRKVPKNAHGTINLDYYTSSTKIIIKSILELYDKIIDKKLLVRRINISANNLLNEDIENKPRLKQIDLFNNQTKDLNYDNIRNKEKEEKKVQKVMIELKKKYGKNSILKGMNLIEGGTTIERNQQVGGHKG